MNTLKIKLNPYKDINIASLDNKPLSPYSELNNFMKEPFLKWANQLLDATERELNDDFKLIVAGEEFEIAFLKALKNSCESCVEFEKEKFQIASSIDERYGIITALATKYGVLIDYSKYCMPVYSEINVEMPDGLVTEASIESSVLHITTDKLVYSCHKDTGMPKIYVLKSDVSKVTCVGSMQYVWEVEEEHINDSIRMIIERFVKVPVIVAIAKELEAQKSNMDEEDIQKLAVATEIDMFIQTEVIPNLEVGEVYCPVVKTIPESEVVQNVRMISLNPSVLLVDGGNLHAKAIGRAVVEFYREEEIIPFSRQEVLAYEDNCIKKISLSASEKSMGIGKEQKIHIAIIPEDADDRTDIKWSVDNNEIAEIDNSGHLIARREGNVLVKASSSRVENTIEIKILPNISEISLSKEAVKLFVGEATPIEVHVTPTAVFNAEYEWKTSDKTVALIEISDDGQEVIRAVGIGKCNLVCAAKEGQCQKRCEVTVESTFKKRENDHSWLSMAVASLLISIICNVMSIDIGHVIGSLAATVCGIAAGIKNKKDWISVVIIILLAVITI